MRMFFVILLFLPSFLFYFPTICLENTDTINISGYNTKKLELILYLNIHFQMKTLSNIVKGQNKKHSRFKRIGQNPITFWQIILIVLIVILVVVVIQMATVLNDIS